MTMNYDEFYNKLNDENFTPRVGVRLDPDCGVRAVSLDLAIDASGDDVVQALNNLANTISGKYEQDDEVWKFDEIVNRYDDDVTFDTKGFYDDYGMIHRWDVRAA